MIFYDNTTISEGLVQQVWLAYKGNNRWPSSGTDKYNRILMVANRKLRELVNKGTKDWSFFWSLSDVDTVAQGDQDYNLGASVLRLSDYVYLYDGSTEKAKIEVVKPTRRHENDVAYLTGANPRVLNFSATFPSGSPYIGNTIKAGVYSYPTAISAAADTIPMNDPEWLVYEIAAELARNDPAKDDQFPNLQGIANDKYNDLMATDEGCPFEQINAAPIRMPRIA